MKLYLEPFENYVYNGRINISGTFGEHKIKGSDKVYFGTSQDNICFIQTDKPLYKEGQTGKDIYHRVLFFYIYTLHSF